MLSPLPLARLLPALMPLALSLSQLAFAEMTTLSPQPDTIVDPRAHTFTGGRWGIAINGQTFQQEGVTTFNGYQYAAFFTEGGYLSIGRRKLPSATWETIRFADYQIEDHKDAHNVAVVGICPGDGSVHLSFDHHVHLLHYRRSVSGLATHPENFVWKAEHFSAVTSELIPGQKLDQVTYPQFFTSPQGNLQLIFRTGWSGSGDWHLWEYHGVLKTWSRVGLLLSKEGVYEGSDARCAYPDQFRYGRKGDSRLHVTWTWREETDLMTNHDVFHAYSADLGRTWKNDAGKEIADLAAGRAMSLDNAGSLVKATPLRWGSMNTTTLAIDAEGFPHTVRWENPPEAAEGNKDLNAWRYFHFWLGADAAWHSTGKALPLRGRKPQLAMATNGDALLVYCEGEDADYHSGSAQGRLKIAKATKASGWSDWAVVYESMAEFIGEPLLDHPRWETQGVLSVYIQEAPTQAGQPSALHVLDFVP